LRSFVCNYLPTLHFGQICLYNGYKMQSRLSFKELLLIAEATLDRPYAELEDAVCVFRAESALAAPFVRLRGMDLYPDPIDKAAICAARLIRTRPFGRGNRAVGYECMREMLVRAGRRYAKEEEVAADVVETLNRLRAGKMDQAEFVRWVRQRVRA